MLFAELEKLVLLATIEQFTLISYDRLNFFLKKHNFYQNSSIVIASPLRNKVDLFVAQMSMKLNVLINYPSMCFLQVES